MNVSILQQELLWKAVLEKLQSRGEHSLSVTEQGVRVVTKAGTRSYPTMRSFLLAQVPESFESNTPVDLQCCKCGGRERLLLGLALRDGRMSRHFATTEHWVRLAMIEELGALCEGSLQAGRIL